MTKVRGFCVFLAMCTKFGEFVKGLSIEVVAGTFYQICEFVRGRCDSISDNGTFGLGTGSGLPRSIRYGCGTNCDRGGVG